VDLSQIRNCCTTALEEGAERSHARVKPKGFHVSISTLLIRLHMPQLFTTVQEKQYRTRQLALLCSSLLPPHLATLEEIKNTLESIKN